MRYTITGTAGFIGFHLALKFLQEGKEVVGLDSFVPYYPVVLKEARHEVLKKFPNFIEQKIDLCDWPALEACFKRYPSDRICHLAAQPGVRYSLVNPFIYQKSNLEGFIHLLEVARQHDIRKFVYASSSSVYGAVKEVPFQESQSVDTPISLYAATKRSNELIAYTYTHIYKMQTVGLRFFTVYGPWGRPDMAIWKFTDAIQQGLPLQVFNFGKNERDFTYIDDIVEGIDSALHREDLDPYEIINLGNNHPESTMQMISFIEKELDQKAQVQFLPRQPGDMVTTFADLEKARNKLGFQPKTSLEKGISHFVSWFKEQDRLISKVRAEKCLG